VSLKREILSKVSAVPPMPEVIIKLRDCCNDPDVNYSEMAKVIETDAGLTSSILRLANSAYFGCSGSISSVQFAMTRLGLKRVHQMALAICVAPLARVEVAGYDLTVESLWEHSLATAVACSHLAKATGYEEPSDAFTGGMLHDLGKSVLGMFVHDEIDEIRRLVDDEGYAFDEAERAVLGTDHAAVAGMLLRHWKVPDHIAEAVRWHHLPERCEGDRRLTDLIHVADILCMDIGWGGGRDGLEYRQDYEAARRLGVNNAAGERIVSMVQEELRELKDLFELTEEGVH
jgi:HD-like signal output (HDOD) protein